MSGVSRGISLQHNHIPITLILTLILLRQKKCPTDSPNCNPKTPILIPILTLTVLREGRKWISHQSRSFGALQNITPSRKKSYKANARKLPYSDTAVFWIRSPYSPLLHQQRISGTIFYSLDGFVLLGVCYFRSVMDLCLVISIFVFACMHALSIVINPVSTTTTTTF